MHDLKGDMVPNRILYARRTIGLGDAIFTLLKGRFKGAGLLRQRFLTRPTKPCFIETEIASLLGYNGLEVEVIGESGMPGKEDGPLTVQTISNTLKSKRTQVPSIPPAILYMRIPAEWMESPRQVRPSSRRHSSIFFGDRIDSMPSFWYGKNSCHLGAELLPVRECGDVTTTVQGIPIRI